MKMTPVALMMLSVLTLSGCDDIKSSFDGKEVKTVRNALASTEPGELSVKSWDVLLTHRAMCQKATWSFEQYGDADAVVYRCEVNDANNQLMKAYSQSLLDMGSTQKQINDLKIELDEIDRNTQQMTALAQALDEMTANGLADIYGALADTLNVGYVDYEALLKGQHVMRLLPRMNADDYMEPKVQANYLEIFNQKLNEVKDTLLRHGIDASAVQALGLYRSVIENSDYLRMKREDRDAYMAYDTALLKERRESVVNDMAWHLKQQQNKETTTPPAIKTMQQTVVFDFTPGKVKPIYCGLTYTLNGEAETHTVDNDFAACLRMSTAQTWNDEFNPVFKQMLPQ